MVLGCFFSQLLSSRTDSWVYFPLSFCPSCSFWCVSPYLLELAGEKGRAVSFLLFKVQKAGYCWEPLLFSGTCLFSFHLSLSSFRRECRPVQMSWKDHYIHTALTHLHVLCTFMFLSRSGAHQGTFLCICIPPRPYLWFLFWTELKRGPVCAYQLIKWKVSSGHLPAPDCVSARLTAGERGKHRETLLSHPDLCFDESHQTMSISKRHPQRKNWGRCVCGRYTKRKERGGK